MKIALIEHEEAIGHGCLDEIRDRFPDIEITIFEKIENAVSAFSCSESILICACRQMLTGDSVHALRHIHARLPGATVVVIRCTADLLALVSLFRGAAAKLKKPGDAVMDAPPSPHGGAPSDLTGRENGVMLLLSQGLSNKLIARRLNLSTSTVKTHLAHIFRKIGVSTRLDAICKFNASGRGGAEAPRPPPRGSRAPEPWPLRVVRAA